MFGFLAHLGAKTFFCCLNGMQILQKVMYSGFDNRSEAKHIN